MPATRRARRLLSSHGEVLMSACRLTTHLPGTPVAEGDRRTLGKELQQGDGAQMATALVTTQLQRRGWLAWAAEDA